MGEKILGVNTLMVSSTPRKTGVNVKGPLQRTDSGASLASISVTLGPSTPGLLCGSLSHHLAQAPSASLTGCKLFLKLMETNHCICILLPGCLSIALPSSLDWWGCGKFQLEEVLFISSPCSAELYQKRRGKKVFFPSTAKKKKIKLV